MKAKSRRFWKRQSIWTRLPASIDSFRCEKMVGIGITPEHRPGEDPPPSMIFLSPQEALAFASWLAEQSEHLIEKERRAAARASARQAARLQKREGGA